MSARRATGSRLPLADTAGVAGTLVCMLHCLVGPLLAGLAPSIGVLVSEQAEVPVLSASLALSGSVVLHAAVRRYRRWRGVAFVLGGGILLAAARAMGAGSGLAGVVSLGVGTGLVVTGHLVNARDARACARTCRGPLD